MARAARGAFQMYEHRKRSLLAWPAFIRRALRHLAVALGIVFVAVAIGTIGYHITGSLDWLDAFLNASMILSGEGPVDRLNTAAGKLFAALYALFSGIVFISVTGVIAAPWVHRLFHWVHLEER